MQTPFKILCAAGTAALCFSCGGNNRNASSGYSDYEKPDTSSAVLTMKDYHYSAEV